MMTTIRLRVPLTAEGLGCSKRALDALRLTDWADVHARVFVVHRPAFAVPFLEVLP